MEEQNNLLSTKHDHHNKVDRQRHHAKTADAGALRKYLVIYLRKTLDNAAFVCN